MFRSNPFFSILTLLAAACVASAAPIRPQKPRLAIAPSNVSKLQPMKDLDYAAHRIVRGPEHGELALVRWEKPVQVISDADFRPLRKIADGKKLVSFASSRGADRFAWAENNSRVVVQDASGKTFEIETGNSQPGVAFSPDGKLFATGGYGDRAKIWDAKGKVIHELDCGGKGGLWPVYSPDGKTLAVGNRNDDVRLFDAATGKLLHVLQQKMSQQLAFSPDGSILAVGYVDGSVSLWNVAKGELLHSRPTGGQEVYTLDWSPKGELLVTAGLASKIVLWDPTQLKALREIDAPGWVISARFTADGSRLLTSGAKEGSGTVDRKIVVWGLGDGDK